MDYSYDEQEQDVADLAARIIGDAAVPERLAAWQASGEPVDRALWTELAKAGLIGIALPEEHGGSGAGFVEQGIVIEEAAKAALPLFLTEAVVMAALPISRYGTEEQHRRLVAPFAAGDLLLSSAPRRASTSSPGFRARPDGDAWRIDGAMSHVPLAADADRVLVQVTDDQGRTGLLLVDPEGRGVTLTPHTSVDRRLRWRLTLDDHQVPGVDVVTAPGGLTEEAERWIEAAETVARCLEQLGTVETALQMTASYASERRQFGRPIGTFQAVSHKLADAYIDVQAIRLTAWRAAWLLDRGTSGGEEVAIAAWWAADAPTRVLEAAMQVHGGISVDLDYPLHRYFLAARQGSWALGGPSRILAALGDAMAAA
ncbi:acyl-CoA dehydrogenase family protein [Actinomadura rudentiformis]|uniref:Acyl-CoA dehydrogenase n=1 Tax=Actinomadura rudentiformis TaxID=359158 RepID=A0A6H9YKD2_9ACTN|nr:acyl-CoA dehydrogenase family protein [Actinomadura rudentiformis]KAB2341553.1 acyl-CoA dehydrogenase [Actinomadura rudentiformis]